MRKFQSLGVFCGSSAGTLKIYGEAASNLGRLLAAQGIKLIYGGGNIGLMGQLADACLLAGGEVCGVITRKLRDVELAHPGVSEMLVVETMAERKSTITALSEGYIALPGGYGTLDELFEVLTLQQLNIEHKPIGLLNTAAYYDPFRKMVDHAVQQRFIRPEHTGVYTIADDPQTLLSEMASMQAVETKKWLDDFRHNEY